MRWAYADPPYEGCARKHYQCPEVDHEELIERLQVYDGWALSCKTNSLRHLLPRCPPRTRVAAWVKPFAFFKKGVRPTYAWEPVLFVPLRTDNQCRALGLGFTRDWVPSNVWGVRASERALTAVKGRKPPAFCQWLFRLVGAIPEDEFDDLYPGSGAVGQEWTLYTVLKARKEPVG